MKYRITSSVIPAKPARSDDQSGGAGIQYIKYVISSLSRDLKSRAWVQESYLASENKGWTRLSVRQDGQVSNQVRDDDQGEVC